MLSLWLQLNDGLDPMTVGGKYLKKSQLSLLGISGYKYKPFLSFCQNETGKHAYNDLGLFSSETCDTKQGYISDAEDEL